jgi:prophage regulatory protein
LSVTAIALAEGSIGERTILELERVGKFPKRFSITARAVAWNLEEVDAWIEQQKAAATPQTAPGPKRR